MSIATTYGGLSFRKASVAIAIATAVLLVAGSVYLLGIQNASAVAPSDYGLKEGNTISAAGSSDPDVYIVNDWGYKRLFLNPVIFSFYGHLGGFAAVKNVSPSVRDAFVTSGLFRLVNDKKVWAFESTGEDTGVLHWVNLSGDAAVAQDPNFFKKVFVINENEYNWYQKNGADYTSLSQVPVYSRVVVGSPTPTPVAGALTASLASNNPGAATLTTGANGVTFLNVNLSGTGTVSSLRVVRHGPGKVTDFSNVYLYDGAKRLTSSRTLSSADGSATFAGLSIDVSGNKVLSLVADLSSATTGDVNYLSIDSASDIALKSGTVGGSFPLNGSNFTVGGQAGGGITIANSGSLGNPNVGQKHVQLAEFKLTSATEAAKVSRIQLIQGGNVKMADLSNLTVEVLGSKVADGVTLSTGYVVFDFGATPFVIAKGDNRIFKVYGDVNGKKAETIDLYLEVTSDLLTIGDQFGFGMAVTNNFNNSSNSQTLTLQGGVLTLSFIGPTATNVSTTTTKTHLLDFDITAASDVELKKHGVILCKDNLGTGTYADNSDTSNGWNDVESVGIMDRDTGVILVGTADGSAFTNSTLSALTTSCPNGKTGAGKLFTDTFTMKAGETKHLAVVGNIKTANTGSGKNISSTDVIKAVLYGYGTQAGTSGDLTVAKYANTNTALTSSDIVPSGDISGNNMTVQGSTLTLALAANPATGNHNFVKNTKNVTANGFSFTTAQGNPVTLTAITLSGYVSDSGTGTTGHGQVLGKQSSGADSNLSVSNLVSAVRLIDGDTGTVIATAPTSNNLSNTTGTAAFTSLAWAIPGGATKTMLVQVDLANFTSGSNDTFSFDVAATTDVTAVDQNSNTINLSAGNSAVNGTNGSTTYVTTNSSGTLAIAAAADTPAKAPVYWGQSLAPFSKFKFTSQNEGFYIEKLYLNTGDTATDLVNNVDTIQISYVNQGGSTLTAVGTPTSSATMSFNFDGSVRPYVPKDGSSYITVYANMKSAGTLFRATGKNFSIDIAGTSASIFRAVGEGSSAVITGTTTGTTSNVNSATAGQNMYVYRSYPQFTLLSNPSGTVLGIGQDILKFKIDALGLYSDGATVFLDGATGAASGSLKFAVLSSGSAWNGAATSVSMGFDLRRVVDADNLTVDQLVATRTLVSAKPGCGFSNCAVDFGQPNQASSATFRFQDVATNQSVEIPAGKSNTFVIRINSNAGFTHGVNSNTGRSADYIQFILRNDVDSLIKWTDNGGTNRNGSEASTAKILKNLPVTGTQIFHQ